MSDMRSARAKGDKTRAWRPTVKDIRGDVPLPVFSRYQEIWVRMRNIQDKAVHIPVRGDQRGPTFLKGRVRGSLKVKNLSGTSALVTGLTRVTRVT